jgi:CBS domain-containing protein
MDMVANLQYWTALKAADLMTQPVLLVPREMSLCAAARLLAQARVSGAPVVDEDGRCIGVLSNTDFLHYAEREGRRRGPCRTEAIHAWQIVAEEATDDERVGDCMTADPVTVPPHTSIQRLAHMMMDAHIHRLIVVDNRERPIGIVSSTDILAAVAQAEAPA